MPKYFFHFHNDEVIADEKGAELPDTKAARSHAIQLARQIAAESVLEGYLSVNDRVEIQDGYGGMIASIQIGEAIEISFTR